MTAPVTCAHDWKREASGKAGTTVTLTCRYCGATSITKSQTRSRTVTTSLEMFPATGATMLDPDLYEFFVRHWDGDCRALAAAGYTVNRKPPVIHTQARSYSSLKVKENRSRGFTGRDLALFFAVALLGGVVMLVGGLTFHIAWIAGSGGLVLGILLLLALLVIFLSN